MSSPDPSAQRADVADDSPSLWRVLWVDSAASTNDDALARVQAGEPAGLVIATSDQTAGHGRLGRTWVAPPGSALAMSVVIRPERDPSDWSLLPLIAGLAARSALSKAGLGGSARLKWPNDVVVGPDEHKICGVLCVATEGAVVMGIGINTAMTAEQLPVPTATSLHVLGVDVRERELCDRVLAELGPLLAMFDSADDESLLDRYREVSATLGRDVTVQMPGGDITGTASDIAADGSLLLRTGSGIEVVGAGDVIHLRARS